MEYKYILTNDFKKRLDREVKEDPQFAVMIIEKPISAMQMINVNALWESDWNALKDHRRWLDWKLDEANNTVRASHNPQSK